MAKLHIIQAGTGAGSFSGGVEKGPAALLDSGIIQGLEAKYEVKVHDPLVITGQPRQSARESLVTWLQALGDELTQLPQEDLTLVLGGDHSVGGPSLLASAHRFGRPAVVYIDAHPDCHRLETSSTGNLHGMPITIATGETLASDFGGPYLKPEDICFLGIKDIDAAEQRWLDGNKVQYFTMDDVIEQGIGPIMAKLSQWVAGRQLHVSFDIDSIDSQFAPGTGIRNSGGLTYREASYIARRLALLNPQVVDMVEVNPTMDKDNQTVLLAVELITALFGEKFDPYTRYLAEHVEG